jgi:predicted acyl esterase
VFIAGAALALLMASGASAAEPSFDAHGSVEQVYATGLPAGADVSLLDSTDQVVETRQANDLGGTLFREVQPGDGYRVRLDSTGETSGPLTVLTKQSAPPSTDIYNQSIPSDGYGYMSTRDGTKLAYSVHPPTDVINQLGGDLPPSVTSLILDHVPSPTLVEYSGYGYARPSGPVSGIAALANLMGFTVVDVNMRGTGCSGGSFDFFEPLQNLDGYDVVETVAHQPWVAHNKVGMFGISYGGISQLFTAQTQPPDLAAVAPLSVIDQTQTTLYPGGVLNTGFAVNWAQERQHEALPAGPDSGQPYAYQQIQAGDQTCASNQTLHPEAADLMGKIRANDHYVPEVADPLAPTTFVDKINVPTFMACQWTDEQTGGHCPTLAEKILTGPHPEQKWFTFTNGVHTDSLDPATYERLFDFLEIYVAKESPLLKSLIVNLSYPAAFQGAFGIDGPLGLPPLDALLPPDPIMTQPTLETAKAAFEQQPPVRVLFDNGAGNASHPGWPYPAFERSYTLDPAQPPTLFTILGTVRREFHLGPNGTLADAAVPDPGADAFTWDSHARPPTDFTGDTASGPNGLWTANPPYDWSQDPDGTAVAYVSPPLGEDTAVVGSGRVDLWVRSSAPNVDLQATISEVRPDGKETFVQGGWIRSKARTLDAAKSNDLEAVPTLRQEDFADMPADQYVPVTIPLYYEGHMYRAGSRIRVRISAPGGDQPIWAFAEAEPAGQANVEIGYGGNMPSSLSLPVVPGPSAPASLPPCPSLRGEPCRDYVPIVNRAGVLPTQDEGSGSDGTGSSNSGTGGAGDTGALGSPGSSKSKVKCKKTKHAGAAAAKKHCKKKR